jgi:hypothetical protein
MGTVVLLVAHHITAAGAMDAGAHHRVILARTSPLLFVVIAVAPASSAVVLQLTLMSPIAKHRLFSKLWPCGTICSHAA